MKNKTKSFSFNEYEVNCLKYLLENQIIWQEEDDGAESSNMFAIEMLKQIQNKFMDQI